MQYLREKTEAVINLGPERLGKPSVCISKNGGPPQKPTNAPTQGDGQWWSLALSADDTDTRGRFEVFDDGAVWDFMVLATKSYDVLVNGAAYWDVNVKQLADGPADRLADFANQGYDAEKHRIVGIDRVDSVGSVEKPVPIDDHAIMEALRAIVRNMVPLHDPNRVIKANIVGIEGMPLINLIRAFTTGYDFPGCTFPRVGEVGRVQSGNVDALCGNAEATALLVDFLLKCYDAHRHAVSRVSEVEATERVRKVVEADVKCVNGSIEAAEHAKAAFTTGYDFPGSKMPVVGEVQTLVDANLCEVAGNKEAAQHVQAAFTRGYDFQGCSMPETQRVASLPVMRLADDKLDTIVSALGDLKAQAPVEMPEFSGVLSMNLTAINGDAGAAERLRKAFAGEGWDCPGWIMNVRVKQSAEAAAVGISGNKVAASGSTPAGAE